MAWHTNRIGRLDRWALIADPSSHTLWFDVGRAVSFAGSTPIVTIVTLRLAYLLWRWGRRPRLAIATLVAVGSAGAFEFWAKRLIERPRPMAAVLDGYIDFSFPSGHTTGATALAVAAIVAIQVGPAAERLSLEKRRLATFGLGCYAVAVAASRVVVGAHYVTDTIAGLAVGGLFASLTFAVALRLESRARVAVPSGQE
jgi:membrane-associated phospholipid phosphatase